MLAELPVERSVATRAMFIGTACITAVIMWWAKTLAFSHAATRLSPIFAYLFTNLDYVGASWDLLIVIAAACVPERDRFRSLLGWIGRNPWPVASAVCIMLGFGALLVYRNHAPTMDEFAPYFQSQVFAAGYLAGRFPPALIDWLIPPELQNQFLVASHATGRVASAYWPSFALLLTPFTFLGIPWACNPVLSALTLVAIHRLALRIFADQETAGLAVLLTVASPVFFANGISYYSMPAHLLTNCVFALLLIDPTPRRALAAGSLGSVALTLHNPVPHMLFALPWILATSRRQNGSALIGWLLTGYAPLCLLLGLGWFTFAGSLPHEGVSAAAAAVPSQGGLARIGGIFSLPDSSIWLARLIGLAKIWVWAVPGMLILALVGAWRWRHDPTCRTLITCAVVTLAGFLLVPVDQGHGWGFRYFHSAWMVLPLLAAGALRGEPVNMQPNNTALRTYLVACALLTLTLGWGLRAVQIHDFISNDLQQTPAYAGTEHRVIIINPSTRTLEPVPNDPWLRGDVIRMVGHGPRSDAAVMRQYFPGLSRVYTDRYGSVWSAAAPAGITAAPR